MEFLKDILGEDLYKQVSDTVNAYNGKPENKDKQVKLADLGSGQYVDKGKYDTAVAEKENLAGQIKTLNTTIGDLKKIMPITRRYRPLLPICGENLKTADCKRGDCKDLCAERFPHKAGRT